MKFKSPGTAALAVLLIFAGAPVSAQELRSRIEGLISAPVYRQASWGILVADAATGTPVYALNEDKLMRPASVTKLFSVAAALEALGPDFRFHTPVYRNGELRRDGTLRGDLILVASGDPTMGGRTGSGGRIEFRNVDHIYSGFTPGADITDPDPLAGIRDLARQIRATGIRRITGDVIVDDRLFERAEGTGSGPSQLTPIVINDNLIDVIVTAGEQGRPASVRCIPESAAIRLQADVTTVAPDAPTELNTFNFGGQITVRGQIAAGHKPALRIREVENPAMFARSVLAEALAKEGIQLKAAVVGATAYDRLPAPEKITGLPRVAMLVSPPLAEHSRLILKVSHNLHAGMLPLLLAAREGKRSLDEGLQIQRAVLRRMGFPVDAVSFGSAAGGSGADFASAAATVELLKLVSRRPYADVFRQALPALGVDGTLWDVVSPASPARGRVHAKTGTYVVGDSFNARPLLTSKALAGYLEAKTGRRFVFAVFLNNVAPSPEDGELSTAARHGRALGRLCEILYDAL